MKKILALLLAAVMCLSLAACGDTQYEKYDALIGYLESGDREQAYKELDKLLPEQSTDGEESSLPESSLPDNSQPDNSQLESGQDEQSEEQNPDFQATAQLLYGDWLPTGDVEEAYRSTITFHEDNTCVIAGETFAWEIVEEKEQNGTEGKVTTIDISDAGKLRYCCSMSQKDGLYRIQLGVYDEEGTPARFGLFDSFFRAADYTAVEITMDNWSEYFEDYYEIAFHDNAFGEVESADILQWLLSKEQYAINGDISTVAVAYEYESVSQEYTADPESGTFSFGKIVSTDNWHNDTTDTMRMTRTNNDETKRYGLFYLHGTTPIRQFPSGTVTRNTNYEITRIAGTIYIAK